MKCSRWCMVTLYVLKYFGDSGKINVSNILFITYERYFPILFTAYNLIPMKCFYFFNNNNF